MKKSLFDQADEISKDEQDFSSGVVMTVWQNMAATPELAAIAHQQEQIMELQIKVAHNSARLDNLEHKLKKMERSYKSLLKTINAVLKENKE